MPVNDVLRLSTHLRSRSIAGRIAIGRYQHAGKLTVQTAEPLDLPIAGKMYLGRHNLARREEREQIKKAGTVIIQASLEKSICSSAWIIRPSSLRYLKLQGFKVIDKSVLGP